MDCLHCTGTGVEPFSDEEDCTVCEGEADVPEWKNLRYYKRVEGELQKDEARELERVYRPKYELNTDQASPPEAVYQHLQFAVEEALEWDQVSIQDVSSAAFELDRNLRRKVESGE